MRTSIEQKTLKNGIKVITHESRQTSFASFCIAFGAGAHVVKKKETGLAHIVEHCIMNSTKKHTKEELSAFEKDHAASSNAATGEYFMSFIGDCFSKDLFLMLDVAFERIFEPAFDEKETEEEKQIIHQELDRELKSKRRIRDLKIEKTLFPKTYYNSLDTLGSHEGIDSVKVADLKKFAANYLTVKNMVVSVTGNVKIEQLSKYLLKKFKEKAQTGACVERACEKITAKSCYVNANLIENNSFRIYFHITDEWERKDRNFRAFFELADVLAGVGKESVLRQVLREQKQLVYSVFCRVCRTNKSSYLYIEFETTKLEQVFEQVVKVLLDVAKNGVSERLLNQSREKQRREILSREEDIRGRNPGSNAIDILFGQECSIKLFKELDEMDLSLTNEDVKAAAKKLLQNNRIVIAGDSKEFGEDCFKIFMKYYKKACKEFK